MLIVKNSHTARGTQSADSCGYFSWQYCWRKYFRKENPGMNYLLHIESNESRKNMVPENSKTIYANSKNP